MTDVPEDEGGEPVAEVETEALETEALETEAPGQTADSEDAVKPKKRKKNKAGVRWARGRGVQTMFRTSYRSHIELTALADTKANILLGINGVIATVAIAFLPRLVVDQPLLATPLAVLVVGSVISLVYCVLAARPRVSSHPVSLAQVRRNEASMLFFGHFVNMTQDDYIEGMHELMDKPDLLYDNMVRDIFGLGGVLARKYELLRTAYNVFMTTALLSAGLTAIGSVAGLLA